ncbi:MAG: DUF402 domain-containing protein [Candidatus Bathyarchaeota archaeon]|nr:DUF402 domain-containing protein [Candidatus Bathyarchaeota archaeon]
MCFKVKVRGIYATALTKLLLDVGFTIVDPSLEVKRRLNLEDSLYEEPDVYVTQDDRDPSRIIVEGASEACKALIDILRREVPCIAVFESKFNPYSIYLATVVAGVDEGILVNIGGVYGLLVGASRTYSIGERILVQVQAPCWSGIPKLSDNIVLRGRFTKISQGFGVEFDPRIRSEEVKMDLARLVERIGLKGFKVYFSAYSTSRPITDIATDLSDILSKYLRISRELNEGNAPRIVEQGVKAFLVEFTGISKAKLDEIRSSTTPTVEGHHSFKCCEDLGKIVDFSEYLIARGFDRKTLSDILRGYVHRSIELGSRVDLIHATLTGRVLKLKPGMVKFFDGRSMIVKRVFTGKGMYDGLNIPISSGDVCYTVIEDGSWFLRHIYLSQDGLKGEYINVNTPPEILPGRVRYLDLAVDVVKTSDGDVRIVDLEELERFLSEGVIGRDLYELAIAKAREAEDGLKSGWKSADEILRYIEFI